MTGLRPIEVRGRPGPQMELVPSRNADGDVRAPARATAQSPGNSSQVLKMAPAQEDQRGSAHQGARASSPAMDFAPDRNADGDVRVPSRATAQSPGNSVQTSRWRVLKNASGLRPSRCAGVLARNGPCTRPECGRGRPRTVEVRRIVSVGPDHPRSLPAPSTQRSLADSSTCASFPLGTPSRPRACSCAGPRGCGPMRERRSGRRRCARPPGR